MVEVVFEEVRGEPLSAVVLRAMREAIIDGRLAPGEAVNEVDLARQFHVSRAPIREAIRQLESEGLVTRVPYRGTAVSSLTAQAIDELQGFRRLIETFAAEQALERAITDDLTCLAELVRRMTECATNNEVKDLNEADVAFHSHIIEMSGNSLIIEVWRAYVPRIRRVLALRNRANRDLRSIVKLHSDLLEAFQQRDISLIHECYRQHGTDLVPALRHLVADGEAPTAVVSAR